MFVFLLWNLLATTAGFHIILLKSVLCFTRQTLDWKDIMNSLPWRLMYRCHMDTVHSNWLSQSETFIYDRCHDNARAWSCDDAYTSHDSVWLTCASAILGMTHALLFVSTSCYLFIASRRTSERSVQCLELCVPLMSPTSSIGTNGASYSYNLCC